MKERKTVEIELKKGKVKEQKTNYLHGKQSEATDFMKKIMKGQNPKKTYDEFKG